MPNIKKEIEKCKHPHSRKTIALTKQLKKIAPLVNKTYDYCIIFALKYNSNKNTSKMFEQDNRKKTKNGQFIKQNLNAEKVAWFRDKISSDSTVCSPEEIQNMIQNYLARYDEELDQINIKHSVGSRKNRQHASREDIITMTKKRELEEFNTCGTEIPDLLSPKNVKIVLKWNGELRFLQNIKMRRFSKKFLEQQILKNINTNKTSDSVEEKCESTEIDKDMDIE